VHHQPMSCIIAKKSAEDRQQTIEHHTADFTSKNSV
jgi:hypothetical protein